MDMSQRKIIKEDYLCFRQIIEQHPKEKRYIVGILTSKMVQETPEDYGGKKDD